MKHYSLEEGISQFPNLPITVYCCNWHKLTHRNNIFVSRPTWRCYWYPDGGAGIEFQDKTNDCKPDEFWLIPPNTPIRHLLYKPCWHFYIHASCGLPFDSISNQIFKIAIDSCYQDQFRKINRSKPFRQQQLLACSFFAYCLSQIPEDVWPVPMKDSRIEKAIDTIQNAYATALDNANLAKRDGLSCNAFIRLFRKQVGISPKTYIIQYRLNRACHLLLYSDNSIDEIAANCGFRDRNYMSRLFKHKLHFSPAEYRRNGLAPENG